MAEAIYPYSEIEGDGVSYAPAEFELSGSHLDITVDRVEIELSPYETERLAQFLLKEGVA